MINYNENAAVLSNDVSSKRLVADKSNISVDKSSESSVHHVNNEEEEKKSGEIASDQ